MKNLNLTNWDEWDGSEIMKKFLETMVVTVILIVFILFVIFIFSKEITLIILCVMAICLFLRSKDNILKPFRKWFRFKDIKIKLL